MSYTFKDFEDKLSNNIYYYEQPNQATYDLLIWLRNNKQSEPSEIILPAFISAKVLKCVLAAGYQPILYEVDNNCQVNPLDIEKLITVKTLAVYVMHYFGLPNLACKKLRTLCDKNNCFLIEDCTQTLDSRWDHRELGTIGHASIFSTRNMMQLDSGGILVLNSKNQHFSPSYHEKNSSLHTAYYLIKTRMKHSYYSLLQGYDPLDLAWIPETEYIKLTREHTIEVKKMSWLVKRYLRTTKLSSIIEKRRNNFEYLLNEFLRLSLIKPLIFSGDLKVLVTKSDSRLYLKEHITPYSFPVIVPSGMRGTLLDILRKRGTGCSSGYPEAPFTNKNYRNSRSLSRSLIEIPIHQGISRGQLRRVIHQLEYFEKKLNQNREFFSDFTTKSSSHLPSMFDMDRPQPMKTPRFSLKKAPS